MPPAPKKTVSTDWKSHKATKGAIEKFEAQFGKDMGLGTLSRDDKITPYEVIPTGVLALDYALGIGGLPIGRVGEMWGPEHAGKTTLAMLNVASAQRLYPDKMTAWVDMEQTFDKKWAAELGVDLTRLWLVENPKTAEDVADATKRFVLSGLCSIVVLDSIGGMISKKEFDKEADEDTVGLVAKIVTRMVKQVSPMGHQNGTFTMVINQVRARIGGYGASEDTAGGWALKHITTVKLAVRKGNGEPKTVSIEGKPVPVQQQVVVRVQKNKCAPYGRVAEFWLTNMATDKYGPVGVDPVTEAVDFGIRTGVITQRAGGYYTIPGSAEEIRGREKVEAHLATAPKQVALVRDKVLATLADQVHDEAEEDAEGDPAGMEAFLAEQAASA